MSWHSRMRIIRGYRDVPRSSQLNRRTLPTGWFAVGSGESHKGAVMRPFPWNTATHTSSPSMGHKINSTPYQLLKTITGQCSKRETIVS